MLSHVLSQVQFDDLLLELTFNLQLVLGGVLVRLAGCVDADDLILLAASMTTMGRILSEVFLTLNKTRLESCKALA